MARRKNKRVVKTILIILASLLVCAGIGVAVYFASSSNKIRYYEVIISDNSGEITLSTENKNLAPNLNMITKPISVSLSQTSASSFIRAKIIFENNSDDNRVLSFVSQLNYYVKDFITFQTDKYSWKYNLEDNAFYLMTADTDILRIVSKNDSSYTFIEKLIVPSELEQMDSLNSEGENVQIGEDIKIKVVFESVQSELGLKGSTKISNVREFFNNFAYFEEGDFTSVNGYISSYKGNSDCLTLPKYVGSDYIIGVKENAFNNGTLKTLIIPGNYIYFEDNCFSNLTNLNFVSLKNQAKLTVYATSFMSKAGLEIYAPKQTIEFLQENYGTYSYVNNLKSFTEISETDISKIDKTVTYIYAPNITEFTGKFENFNNLKVVYMPQLTTINENMFSGLVNLIDLDCPNVTEVKNNALNGCSNLLNVSLSKNLTSIGESSFANCTKLNDISFVKNLSVIPNQAFRNCSSITSVNLLNENTEIAYGAFYNNTSLKTVNVLNLTKTEDYSFAECEKLRYFNVSNVTNLSLSDKTFTNLSDVNNFNNILFIFDKESTKNSFQQLYTNLTSLVINIANNKLISCSGRIKNLDLSEFSSFIVIDEIGEKAFANLIDVTSIILPSSVTKIGNNILQGVESCSQLTLNSYTIPTFSENTFEEESNLIVYVPSLSLDLYKATLKHFSVTIVAK